MRLKEKVAIITGGGGGLGREIGLAYIREGAIVVVAEADQSRVEKTNEMFKDMGHRGFAMKVDIKNRPEVDHMVEKTMLEFGKIDVLVNSAAAYGAIPFMDVTEELWCHVIDVTLKGTFRVIQAVAKEMVRKQYGRIINIVSAQALKGMPLMPHYTPAKGGIVSLTRALAAELSPLGITVNSIGPGLTTTENILKLLPPEYFNALGATMALRRVASPNEYNGIAVLLASDEGGYCTGETISWDGGFTNVAPPMASGFSEG